MVESVEQRQRGLHLGCGNDLFRSTGSIEWWNLDLSIPKYRESDIYVIEGDARNLCGLFQAQFFDLIYTKFVLEHIPFGDLPDLLYQMWYVLKKDGIVEVLVPDFLKVLRDCERIARETQENIPFLDLFLAHERIFALLPWESKHQSIWTPSLGKVYLQMDGRFAITSTKQLDDGDHTLVYKLRKRE